MTGTAANTCTFHDFELQIVDETDTAFVLSNCGNPVGAGDSINTQFMLMKDMLGFTQTDVGTFTAQVSKFDDHIRVSATKLVFHEGWLLRVLAQRTDEYQLIVAGNGLDVTSWQLHDDAATKWVRMADTKEVSAFISYWQDRE